jgi:hypothetical protein
MGRYSLLGGLAILCALAFIAPADAITINGKTYVLFAKTAIEMEDGWTAIFGNAGVNDVGGRLRVGAFNIIRGTAAADDMFFGTHSVVDGCDFNTSTGVDPNAVCGSQAPVTAPITVWPPAPVEPVPSCVNTQPSEIVPHGESKILDPGCYGDVRIGGEATLTLAAGTYSFKSLRLKNRSHLNGNGAIVNVKGLVVTKPSVAIIGVTINSSVSRGVVVRIGKGSFLEDVLLNVPDGTVHLHRGVVVGFVVGVVARRIIVDTITGVIAEP